MTLRTLGDSLTRETAVDDLAMRAVDGYRLVRELTAVADAVKAAYATEPIVTAWISEQEAAKTYPDDSDLIGAAKAFLRLQRTYLQYESLAI